jgi:hypothetical protein
MFLLFMCGCGEKKQDTAATEEEVMILPTSTCGLDEYTFLSTDLMGTIVSIEERPELSLEVDAIESLVSNFDLPLPPPQYSVQTYYVQYRTQDKGVEVLATGMISLPEREGEDIPILLWEHPTMGFADECSPTAIGIVGAAYPILFASLGMAVVAPDFLGMSGWRGTSEELHPYFVAEPTAIASLDSLRALQNTLVREEIELDIDPQKLVIWGASEGGYAALMSDRYLPYYAPEFSSVATVAAIPATDPLALAQHGVQEFGPTTVGILGAQVTQNQWYKGDRDLEEVMYSELAVMIEDLMGTQCGDFDVFEEMSTPEDVFVSSYIEGILSGDLFPWTCYLQENSILGTPVSFVRAAPTLIVTAEEDDLAIAAPVHRDIEAMCLLGYEIEHLQCAGLGHVDGGLDTIGVQWDWIQRQLQGDVLANTCIVQEPVECVSE